MDPTGAAGLDMCVTACRESGGFAGVLAVILFLGRWLWAEYNRRKLAGQTVSLKVEKAELQGQVKQLSMQPPALIAGPSLQELAVQITGQAEPPASPDQVDVLVGTDEPPASKS